MIILKVVNFAESVVNSLLFNKLLKLYKLHFFKIIFGKTPLWYYHILVRISVLELHDFPVIRVKRTRLVHVTKLLRHLSIYLQYFHEIIWSQVASNFLYSILIFNSLSLHYFTLYSFVLQFFSIIAQLPITLQTLLTCEWIQLRFSES